MSKLDSLKFDILEICSFAYKGWSFFMKKCGIAGCLPRSIEDWLLEVARRILERKGKIFVELCG